ncbi:MAG: aliphatic sulfonate ABC transporter substrate-binding protein [Campylobacteraceae bacterium]|jgi:taurine transport system substrate-binding protein|nr:aliphatic sulfonate ABC transporter substrate-binding protein [Campylobacteraceae bacterium]
MNSRFLLIFLSIFTITALSADSSKVLTEKSSVVRIATQQMPNDENIAKAKKYFDAIGVDVKLLEFDSGAAVVNAIASGSIDIGLVGTTPAATAISKNLGVELIWIHGVLGKSEALAVKNSANIKSIKDLKGKKAAAPFGSTGHYSLLSALELDGLKPSDVTILDLQPKDIFAAWKRGDIDAAYVWDPVLTSLLDDGFILLTSEDLAKDGVITADVEVVSAKFGKKYPNVVAEYIKALSKAQDDYHNDFNGTIKTLAKYFQISETDAKAQILGNVWLNAKEQLDSKYLGKRGKIGDIALALKKTADFLEKQKSIEKAPPLEVFQKAVNPLYIELSLEK